MNLDSTPDNYDIPPKVYHSVCKPCSCSGYQPEHERVKNPSTAHEGRYAQMQGWTQQDLANKLATSRHTLAGGGGGHLPPTPGTAPYSDSSVA